MKPSSVTLEQMLDARERRAQAQKELLLHAGGNACLVSLSLNIAGGVKRTPKTRLLFDRAMKVFESFGFFEISRLITDAVTGTEALIL
ncbi:MAG: citrate lyase holo-[Clostridia bacterium]|nr:citrate lyase holo-[acyl-carrier protein] synthase [Clostridia bacterium]